LYALKARVSDPTRSTPPDMALPPLPLALLFLLLAAPWAMSPHIWPFGVSGAY